MKTKHDWTRADALTGHQIHAAALAGPDGQPLTPDRLEGMRQTPRLKIIRRALGLTQEEFAARFQIPLGTLRDWEQTAGEPEAGRLRWHDLTAYPGSAHATPAVAPHAARTRFAKRWPAGRRTHTFLQVGHSIGGKAMGEAAATDVSTLFELACCRKYYVLRMPTVSDRALASCPLPQARFKWGSGS